MLLGTLCASLLGNMLTFRRATPKSQERGINRAEYDYKDDGMGWAGYGSKSF